ncbi:MAG: type I methionyl aminopeptidase [SAR202 cluster bacterium]|nr:type I methionyl aminopeptidase [SAR202 cluster bacterium]
MINKQLGITIKSPREMDLMRQAGQIVAKTKLVVKDAIEPGINTKELDVIAEKEIRKLGATPSFKGYKAGGNIPFPSTICVSINDEIVHGIPSNRVINDGDIISVDVGAIVEGYHGDSAFTIGVGSISNDSQLLINSTEKALEKGILEVKSGVRVGDISCAIQDYSEGLGYSVVKQYVGHGIGRELHEEPQIPNYGKKGLGPILSSGMVIAIEPMLTIGKSDTMLLDDGWTVATADGSLSAHFEETVAITSSGSEILTQVK